MTESIAWVKKDRSTFTGNIYILDASSYKFFPRLVVKGTMEQRVVQLQKDKIALAKGVLDGNATRKMTKLTTADIKMLFDIK